MSARAATRLQGLCAPAFLAPGRAPNLQRQCACGQHAQGGECESCKKKKAKLQRHARSGTRDGETAPPIVAEELRTAGQPIETGTRRFMEGRFGHDFSHVRVHNGEQAADSATSVDALAYTAGNHVVFNRGQYSPGTTAGNRLLAHELTHVVQQSANPAGAGAPQHLRVGAGGDRYEKEAEAVSQAVVSGGEAPGPGTAPPTIQRQAPAGGQAKPPAPAPPPPPRDTHQAAPNTDVVEPTTHSTSNYGLGVFESELRSFGAGSPCMLTLRMRLFFDFVDRPAPAPPTHTKWSAAEQNAWTNSFVRGVTSRWSYRYPLVETNPKCAWNKCNRAMARVEVIPVPQAGAPDATLHIAHVPASAYRSNAGYGGANLTQEDVNEGAHGAAHVTTEHEFGHLLGLDHSNPACQSTDAGQFKGTSGQESCYGVTSAQVEDIMGAGSVVTPQDYRPFVQEMNYYTKCDWKTEGSAPKPPGKGGSHVGLAVFGIIGGVVGGILGGLMGGQPGGIGAGWGALAGVGLGGLAGAGLGSLIDWAAE